MERPQNDTEANSMQVASVVMRRDGDFGDDLTPTDDRGVDIMNGKTS